MSKMQCYGIFYNGRAGNGEAQAIAQKVHDRLRQKNIKSRYLVSKSVSKAIKSLKAGFSGLDALLVIGGDGTMNVAVTALIQAKADLPIGIIPAGSVNNFAKRYHIPMALDQSIELLAGPHHLRRVGIATCNEQRAVVSSLTFGHLADISNEVRQEEKRRFGPMVYFVKALQHIGQNKAFKIHYRLDHGQDRVLKTWFALITTTKSIGGHVYNQATPRKMQLSLLHNIGLRQVVPYLFFAMTGRLSASKAISEFDLTHAEISTANGQKIMTRIDGDKAVELPIKLVYCPNRLQLIVSLSKSGTE